MSIYGNVDRSTSRFRNDVKNDEIILAKRKMARSIVNNKSIKISLNEEKCSHTG